MAIRNARTGGARKRVAGETKKGATPKKKGAATKVITGDRLPNGQKNNYKPNDPNSVHAEPKGSTSTKRKPGPDEGDTTVKTKKVTPNLVHTNPKTPTPKTPVSKPAVKAPVKTATRPNTGMVSKPAVKAPASSGRVRNFVASIKPAPKKPMP